MLRIYVAVFQAPYKQQDPAPEMGVAYLPNGGLQIARKLMLTTIEQPRFNDVRS